MLEVDISQLKLALRCLLDKLSRKRSSASELWEWIEHRVSLLDSRQARVILWLTNVQYHLQGQEPILKSSDDDYIIRDIF